MNDAFPVQKPLRFAVVICTRDRPGDLDRTLASITAQKDSSMILMVVDAGNRSRRSDIRKLVVERSDSDSVYLPFIGRPSLARQRNLAVEFLEKNHPEVSIVHFLDDDVSLEEGYFTVLNGRLRDDPSLGGIGGRLIEMSPISEPSAGETSPSHGEDFGRRLLLKLFLLDSNRPGRVLVSGATSAGQGRDVEEPTNVEWLGGCAAYRSDVLARHEFDPRLEGPSIDEDLDFSYRISRKYGLLVEPGAVAHHHVSPVNRAGAAHSAQERLLHRYWFLEKNIRHPLRKPAFWWSALGQLLAARFSGLERSDEVGSGRRRAIRMIWSRTHPLLVNRPSLSRVLHTILRLKPLQILAQVTHRLRGLRLTQHDVETVENAGLKEWNPDKDLLGRGLDRLDRGAVEEGTFRFLNREIYLGSPPDWEATAASKLWRYNLHYFDYIWRLQPDTAQRVAGDWIERYTADDRRDGWEPYPTSLRLQNWCGYFLGLHSGHTASNPEFQTMLVNSIRQQAFVLERNLEYHLLGNHLLENAAALTTVGLCLDGVRVQTARRKGLRLLRAQLDEQILTDGCHFERSPMYQSRLVFLLEQLLAANNDEVASIVSSVHQRIVAALSRLTHPDGQIALLNDAGFHVYPSPAELQVDLSLRGVFDLPQAGYFGARGVNGSYIICDAGPIGPDYLPGHAHGDLLSFELSLHDHRVIVDSGTYGYEDDFMRSYCRSTAAHNTLEIDGADQSEFWDVFRVARRAHPLDVDFQPETGGFRLTASHDGYRRLPGRPIHSRSFEWKHQGELMVNDEVRSTGKNTVVSRLHLHPDCKVVSLEARKARIRHPHVEFGIEWSGDGRVGIENSLYCPEFGVAIENQALTFAGGPGRSSFRIKPVHSSMAEGE